MIKVNREINKDIVIIGGGAAGCNAAIAASRENDVLLIERYGFLGGTTTYILDTLNGFYTPNDNENLVVGGISSDIIKRLEEKKECFYRFNTYGSGKVITYNPETLKNIYENMLIENNVEIMLHSLFLDVDINDNKISAIYVANKKEIIKINVGIVIDCSGDGDVCYKAGYNFFGVGTEPVQSMTTTFRVSNIDKDKATISKKEMWSLMKKGNESGKYKLPREEGSVHETTFSNIVSTNMVRIVIDDPTNIELLTNAEIVGRQQVNEYFRFMKNELPGYEDSELLSSSIQVGVRETRRIIGEYVLTIDDVTSGRKFDDGILACGSPVEDHNASKSVDWQYIEGNKTYQLPYRCLIPKDSKNLLMAGRCISANHRAFASVRSAAQCMAMGQAAGTAAAIAFNSKIDVNDIDTSKLVKTLLQDGVILEMEVNL
jgi:hypothetical protein